MVVPVIDKTLVPVVDKAGTPLQPAHWAKVRRWIKEKRCIPKKSDGIFYIQLNKVVNVDDINISEKDE
jgi:hypothetical protein